MSSINKSEFLNLNQWAGTDIPTRNDFNYDNNVIDGAIHSHFTDDVVHISESERAKWDSPYYMNVYFGNSQSERTIETNCPFVPRFGIVFANVMAPAVVNFSSDMKYNYFAIVSQTASTLGAMLSGTQLTVKQSTTSITAHEYASLNATGYTYCYILFR